jgi:hypothetical protein
VLLPLVENAGEMQEVPAEIVEGTPQPESENNALQYLIFGIIVIGLIAVLLLVLREKRKA